MAKKIIHVNQFVIRHNKKFNNSLPPCRVQYGKNGKSVYCKQVIIKGPSKMVYSPDKPLSCGAKLWIESTGDVEIVDEVPYATIRDAMNKTKGSCKRG